MAETIPGGAYQTASGDWVDANGNPLKPAQIVEAKAIDAERDLVLRAMERSKLEAESRRDPTARAIAAALLPQRPAAREPERASEGARESETKARK